MKQIPAFYYIFNKKSRRVEHLLGEPWTGLDIKLPYRQQLGLNQTHITEMEFWDDDEVQAPIVSELIFRFSDGPADIFVQADEYTSPYTYFVEGDSYRWLRFEPADADGNPPFIPDDMMTVLNALGKWDYQQRGSYKITYQSNGGTSVPEHWALSLPPTLPTPTRSGYIFTGWYYEQSLTNRAFPNDGINDNTILYAGWVAIDTRRVTIYNKDGSRKLDTASYQAQPYDIFYVIASYTPSSYMLSLNFYDQAYETPLFEMNIDLSYTEGLRVAGLSTQPNADQPEYNITDAEFYLKSPFNLYVVTNNSPAPPPSTGSSPYSVFDNIYGISSTELDKLRRSLWSPAFKTSLADNFQNPMESITAVRCYPFEVVSDLFPDEFIHIGNWSSTSKGVSLTTTYHKSLNLGHLLIQPYFNSYLDFSPYTKIELYLPYYGFTQIDVDKCMNKVIYITYDVDIYTGNATINIYAEDQLILTLTCEIGVEIPVAGSNAAEIARNQKIIAQKAVGGMLSGVASSFAAGARGDIAGTLTGIAGVAGSVINLNADIEANKNEHVTSGTITDALSGFRMPQQAFVIIERPSTDARTEAYNHTQGRPCYLHGKLNAFNGYTEAQGVHLENIKATYNELQSIERALAEGVILP